MMTSSNKTLQSEKLFEVPSRQGFKLRSQLSEIANGLKLYEKVSVVFLLCETPQIGVEKMVELLSSSCKTDQDDICYKWLRQQLIFENEDWQVKLAEMLTLLQNYRLAKVLGFSKKELIERFMPKNNLKSFTVCNMRKVLYNLCEELKPERCSQIIAQIESGQNIADTTKCSYLEYKLLTWSNKGIISLERDKAIDLNILVKCLESFNLKKFVLNIEVIVENKNCQLVRSKYALKVESEISEYYEVIDEKNVGLCVIINEKNFTNRLFSKRWGSDKDVERLTEVFIAFGFDIRVHSDLSHKQLLSTLGFYAKIVKKTSSFFVLIILSHGSENVIYTSDSLPVDMNTIEMIFQAEICPNLIGKPKIFIVQSCQGEKWQRALQVSKPDIETDNIVSPEIRDVITVGPQKGDSMIAWSTVQGFASFRDKYNGSWYIQELCNELWKFGDTLDLVEILTKVNNNLRSKVYDGQFMVPSLLLSLRAKIRFPKLQENFLKGKKLMLERLLFEKYFRDFLTLELQNNNNLFVVSKDFLGSC